MRGAVVSLEDEERDGGEEVYGGLRVLCMLGAGACLNSLWAGS